MIGESISVPRSTSFEEFFSLGKEESSSPFLTPSSRKWSINLTLKSSIVAACLLLLAFLLSFSPSLHPLAYLLLVSVYFLAGIPSLIESVEDLINFDINIDVLMTLAAFSSILIGSSMEGALLLVLFALSGSIEDAVTMKAKGSLNQLHRLSPSKATVVDERGRFLERSIKDVTVGTKILIRAGEVVPLDGIVIDGISSVNLVHLTGENLPITKRIGDEVAAGARNLEGTLMLEVIRTSADSTLARIIQLVTQAHEARPQLQRWFDRLSRTYALTIISLSALFAITFPYLLSIPFLGSEGAVYRALAFLIAASPCALIIAIPIAYLSAVSACARQGILLKGGIVLDALAQCSIIAFDKTGTLTTGQLTCTGISPLSSSSPWNNQELLTIAFALEKNAVHPIAKAIVDEANRQNVPIIPLKNFKMIPGYGVEAEVSIRGQPHAVFMGHPDYITPRLSSEQQRTLQEASNRLRQQGQLLAVMMVDQELFLFSFRDTPRPHLAETLKKFKEGKYPWTLLMLTGDHENSARTIATELGIDEFYANLKPEDKLNYVTHLSQEKGLAMVGDGINDAPALARATVGIGMGKVGSGAAIEAADAVLLQDNLDKLDWLMTKARQTQTIVHQNLTIATGAILIASFPALAGWVPLWLAVVMHEGGTVLVGLNALRLLK